MAVVPFPVDFPRGYDLDKDGQPILKREFDGAVEVRRKRVEFAFQLARDLHSLRWFLSIKTRVAAARLRAFNCPDNGGFEGDLQESAGQFAQADSGPTRNLTEKSPLVWLQVHDGASGMIVWQCGLPLAG